MKNQETKSDIKLAKRVGFAVVDTLVTAVDLKFGGLPLTSGAWALAKALLGNGIALRQDKAIEWIEMLRDNPKIFTKKILLSEEFQDAFIISLEGYIKERNKNKRILLCEIFKDYTSSDKPEIYSLERFHEITKRISLFDARNFSYLVYMASEQQPRNSFQDTRHTPAHIESVLHLASLGLLIIDDRPRLIRERSGIVHPYIYISGLGNHYYKFVKEAELTYKDNVE